MTKRAEPGQTLRLRPWKFVALSRADQSVCSLFSLLYTMSSSASAKGDFDMQLKLLLLGDSGVGKTALLMRFCDDKFSATFISTVGVDFKSKILPIEGERVKLQVCNDMLPYTLSCDLASPQGW